MVHSVVDLKGIASCGGGFFLDASQYNETDLKSIASSTNGRGYIVLRNLSKFTVVQLKSIASSGNGHVIFDFDN